MKTIVCKKVQYLRLNGRIMTDMPPKVLRETIKVTPSYMKKFNEDGKATGHQLIEDKEATKKYHQDFEVQQKDKAAKKIAEAALHKETLLAALGSGMSQEPTSNPDAEKALKENEAKLVEMQKKLDEANAKAEEAQLAAEIASEESKSNEETKDK